MVWGNHDAIEKMRVAFEANGWTWATMLLGDKTEALAFNPPAETADADLCALINDVNGGKFGKLNGGFAKFGARQPARDERG